MKKILLFLSFLLMSIGVFGAVTYTKITNTASLTTGDKVVIATGSSSPSLGVTGGVIQNSTSTKKDATVSSTESEWMLFNVTTTTGGWYLVNSSSQYIGKPTDNTFYLTTGGSTYNGICSVNSDGVLCCNSRYLQNNGSYYRMYSLNSSYTKFYVWKVSSETITYTVTYDANGGSGIMSDGTGASVTIASNSFTSPNECLEFDKWNTQRDGQGTNYNPNNVVTVNLTLYAQWKNKTNPPLYTVSFNTGDHSTQTACGDSIALPTPAISLACVDDGWEFAGWSESNSTYTNLKTGKYKPIQDTMLYAVYMKSDGEVVGTSTIILTNNQIQFGRNGNNNYQDSYDIEGWTGKYAVNLAKNNYSLQIGRNTSSSAGAYNSHITTPTLPTGAIITSITLTPYTNYDGWTTSAGRTFYLMNTNTLNYTAASNQSNDFGTGSCTSDNSTVTITTTNSPSQFHIYADGTTYLDSIILTYYIGSTEYSFNPSCCEHQVTITKITNPNGTYDLDKTTVCGDTPGGIVNISNIVPNEGYEFDKILCVDENGEETGNIDNINKRITEITTNCYVVVVFKEKPEDADINVIEWNPDYVKIDIENFEGVVTAVFENKNTQASYEENVATELFFSKYFEAETTVKLLGIYNGKKDSVNLSNYKIKAADGKKKTSWDNTYDLTNLGWIHSGEEIIIYSYSDDSDTNPVVTCIENYSKTGGFSNYIRAKSGSIISPSLTFNGDDAIGLFKDDILIDIIGAGNTSAPNVDGLKGKSTGKDTTMYETHLIDNYCWITDSADNSNGYSNVIATDLCLLIRKSSVHSGDSAVKYNTTDFVTLADEWVGKTVVKKDSSTCKNFDYVGSFDYNEHYTQYVEIVHEIPLSGLQGDDGSYKINIADLDTLSCTYLKVIVSDGSNREEKEYKIPIFVTETVNSDNNLFSQEGDDCPTCDVIITSTGKLTVNSNLQNRDVVVYPGGVLVIPEGKTYHVNSLALRRENDNVPYFSYKGTLNLDDKFYVDIRTDGDDWRWMSLPFAHRVSDITYPNGKKPEYNKEVFIEYYDGQYRAEHKTGAWKYAKVDSIFNAGEGFLFGVDLPGKSMKTYRFTYVPDSVEHEKTNKTIKNLFAYGCNNTELAPNHKGWNLIGNPFMDNDTTDIIDPIRIGRLKKDSVNGHWTGGWVGDTIEDIHGKKLRYAVVPVPRNQWTPEIQATGGYESVVLDDYVLKPFSSFFVQLGGNAEDMQTLTFKVTKRMNRIVARKATVENDEELFLRVKVGNWKTGMFISNQFTDEYEPGDDLESRYPIYQSINGYKLLYSAINDSIIEHGVQVTAPQGTLYLDPKVYVNKFEYIYVHYNDNWYDLMHGETVDIEAGNFILQAKRKQEEMIATGLEEIIPTNGIYKFYDGENIYINVQNSIYNLLGSKVK